MSEAHDLPRTAPTTAPGARQRIVQDFAGAARDAQDMPQLRALLREASRTLGFDHMRLQDASGTVWLADLPGGWRAAMTPSADAVLATAALSYAPFLWSDIPRLLALTDAQRDFLNAVVAAGVGAAVTVPIHRPCGAAESGSYSQFAGCCSFLMKKGASLPLESLAAAHYVGSLAFDAAEKFARTPHRPDGKTRTPQLTPRQRDCVVLVAQGKSDWEIGRLLGISDSTVHKHIEDAKRRFGVCTRIQLVVQALFDARVSFSDVMK